MYDWKERSIRFHAIAVNSLVSAAFSVKGTEANRYMSGELVKDSVSLEDIQVTSPCCHPKEMFCTNFTDTFISKFCYLTTEVYVIIIRFKNISHFHNIIVFSLTQKLY
jgi:hypothetical protein